MVLLLGLLGTAFVSALVPVVNLEVILVATWAQSTQSALALAFVGAVGQMAGKAVWFWGGQNLDRSPRVRRQLEKPKAQAALERWSSRSEGRPVFTAGLLFVSAWTGFPPYAVISVLAGLVRVPWWVFLTTGTAGRMLRFWTVLGGLDAVSGLL